MLLASSYRVSDPAFSYFAASAVDGLRFWLSPYSDLCIVLHPARETVQWDGVSVTRVPLVSLHIRVYSPSLSSHLGGAYRIEQSTEGTLMFSIRVYIERSVASYER